MTKIDNERLSDEQVSALRDHVGYGGGIDGPEAYAALTELQHLRAARGGVKVSVDDLAAVLWRTELIDAGVPQSVINGRTREAFDNQSEDTKNRWRKFARASFTALTIEQEQEPVVAGGPKVWSLPAVEQVLKEMLFVATGAGDDEDDAWLPAQRATIDLWQASIRSSLASPPQEQDPAKWPLSDALKAAEAYIEEYEFDDCDGGYHSPSEVERNIMVDMVNGLLSEDQFVACLRKSFASPPPPSEQSEVVERLFQAVAPFVEGTSWREVRAALTAALNQKGE